MNEIEYLYTKEDGSPRSKWILITVILMLFSLTTLGLVAYLATHPLNPPPLSAPPPDFSTYSAGDERKTAFFDYLVPLVQHQNERVLERRQRILDIAAEYDEKSELSRRSRVYIDRMVAAYRFADEELPVADKIDKLLRRVDQIPVSMVLAQAAMESAWGTSRFARVGNNFFGQWCFEAGCGTVPKLRGEGEIHEVANFDSAMDSVRSYFRNINTHRAYREMREMRAALRQSGDGLEGLELIKGLVRYSERGQDYIRELGQIIRVNRLSQLDESPDEG